MFITLSSKNQTNHSNFTNYFSDIIKISPNSYVCLVSASIVTADGETVITIPAGQRLHIGTNGFNLFRIPLPEGTFTTSDFCNAFNADTNMNYSSQVYSFHLEDNKNGTLSLTFKRSNTSPYGLAWFKDLGWWDNNLNKPSDKYSYWRNSRPETIVPYPNSLPAGIGGNVNCAGIYSVGAAAYNIVSHYGASDLATYDWLPNNDTYCWNDMMGCFYFQTGGHQQGDIYLSPNTYNTVTDDYTLNTADYKVRFEFKVNKKLNTFIKYTNGTDFQATIDTEYHPGDIFMARTVGRDTQLGTGGKPLAVELSHWGNYGLQLWIPFDIPAGTDYEYNDEQGNVGVKGGNADGVNVNKTMDISMYDNSMEAMYNFFNLGYSKFGFRAGCGEMEAAELHPASNGQYILDEYIGDAQVGIGRDGAFSMMPNGNALYLDRANHERYSIFKRDVNYLFGAGETLDTTLPSMIMFCFYLVDDGTSGHCILGNAGGGAQQCLEIDIAGAATQVQFWDGGNNVHNTKFTTIDIQPVTKYCFGISTFGAYQDTGVFQYKLYLREEDGTTHTQVVAATGGVNNLAQIQCIGGKLPAPTGDDSQYTNGNIWDFRYYQHSEYGSITGTDYWDNIFNGISDYSINNTYVGVRKSNAWYGKYLKDIMFNPDHATDPQWNLDYNASSVTEPYNNWYLNRATGLNTQAGTWFDYMNVNHTPPRQGSHNVWSGNVDPDSIGFTEQTEGVGIFNRQNAECISVDTILNLYDSTTAPQEDYIVENVYDSDFAEHNVVADIPGGDLNFAHTDQSRNINIENLPHRSLDGNRSQVSKTIYQLPSVMDERGMGDVYYKSLTAPQKVKIPLNNPGDMYINQLEVKITNEEGQEDATLVSTSNVVIEIKEYD